VIHPSLTRKVQEAAYLTAENAHRYRPIMRFFYEQHGQHRYTLTLDEVRTHLTIQDYTDDLAEQDLRQLVEWGSLTAEQDRSRVRTVDEWLRRRLRYQITPYGIEFERLLVQLEQAHGAGGSLDPTTLDSLWHKLQQLDAALSATADSQEYLQNLRRLWLDAYQYFDTTGKDAADYLAEMHRSRPDDLNELGAFLAFKDVLLQYLGSFLNSLMHYADQVRALLAGWEARHIDRQLVALLVLHDTTYTVDPDGLPPEATVVRAHYQQQVENLHDWFRRRGGVEMLRAKTADAIEMVVRHSQRLMERRRGGLSRRRELEELARCFAACRDDRDAAERLAGLAFGAAVPRHLLGSLEAHAMDERQSVWAGAPMEIPLGRIKGGRQAKARSAPMRDVTAEQQAALLDEVERRRDEAALWDSLFAQGDLSLGDLELQDAAIRPRLLDLVGRCLASPDGTALASDGTQIRLLAPTKAGAGHLAAPDGVLLIPHFKLSRTREKAK